MNSSESGQRVLLEPLVEEVSIFAKSDCHVLQQFERSGVQYVVLLVKVILYPLVFLLLREWGLFVKTILQMTVAYSAE